MSDAAATPASVPLPPPPPAPRRRAIADFLFRPLLAPLLATRKAAIALPALAAAQVAATALRLPGWPCPFFHSTGLPCPGCGLSRACTALLLHGDVAHSLRMHAFAAPILLGLLFALVTALLPATPRAKLLAAIERIERRTGLTSLLLVALFVYWFARLVYAPRAFISLISQH